MNALVWSLTALPVLVASGLIALGIELNRRDYQARDRAALAGGAVVALPTSPAEGDAEHLRAA